MPDGPLLFGAKLMKNFGITYIVVVFLFSKLLLNLRFEVVLCEMFSITLNPKEVMTVL